MDCPIRAESGKGRSAHIFNLNERAVHDCFWLGFDADFFYMFHLSDSHLISRFVAFFCLKNLKFCGVKIWLVK